MAAVGDSAAQLAALAELGLRVAQLAGINAAGRKRTDLTAYASKVLDELYSRAPDGARMYYRKAIALAEIGKPKPFLPWGAFTGGPPPAVALLWRPVDATGAVDATGGEGYELFAAWDLPMFLTALGPGSFLISLAVTPDAKKHAENVFQRAVSVGKAAGDMLTDAAGAVASAGISVIKWASIAAACVVGYKVLSKKRK